MQLLVKSAIVMSTYLACFNLVSAAENEITRNIYQETNGNWQLVKSIKDGVATPDEELKEIQMELKNGIWTARKGDIIFSQGTYKILSLKDGYRIVSGKVTLGENKGSTNKHISKSEGDTLTICHSPEGGDVPTEFTSEKGSGKRLNVWKRISK